MTSAEDTRLLAEVMYAARGLTLKKDGVIVDREGKPVGRCHGFESCHCSEYGDHLVLRHGPPNPIEGYGILLPGGDNGTG